MFLFELPPATAAIELAREQAILQHLETCGQGEEILRLWEPTDYAVILGAASAVEQEVNHPVCRALRVPVLRRPSGGCAVVAGPGCLMYSLYLSLEKHPRLRAPEEAHRWVLGRLAQSLSSILPSVTPQGISDLAWGTRKVGGNSMRRKRRYLLYHGSLLYAFPLELIDWLLRLPPRQPAWRAGRSHKDFLANLPISREDLTRAILRCWSPLTSATLPLELSELCPVVDEIGCAQTEFCRSYAP